MTMNEQPLAWGAMFCAIAEIATAEIVIGWSFQDRPRVLAGWLPSTMEAQRAKALINQGRIGEVRSWLEEVDRQIRLRL